MKRRKGTGSVYKRKGSPVWWIKYHPHGRHSERARTPQILVRLKGC